MPATERRFPERHAGAPFWFLNRNGTYFPVKAADASEQAARFPVSRKGSIRNAAGGLFRLGTKGYELRRVQVDDLPENHICKDHFLLRYMSARTDEEDYSSLGQALRRYTRQPVRGFFKRLGQRVSRIHLYEAQERFVYLAHLVDRLTRTSRVNRTHECKEIEKQELEKQEVLRICGQTLREARVLLTRAQEDLNFLWRELTQVHVMLLRFIVPKEALSQHLDFCREEVRRLGLSEDAEIKEMIQRLAEVMDRTGGDRPHSVRLLTALIERFNSIRTGRIHEQYLAVCCYRRALMFLLPLAIVLVATYPRIFDSASNPPLEAPPAAMTSLVDSLEAGDVSMLLVAGVESVARYLAYNDLAFVVMAGLLGGFTSVIIRLRTKHLTPGEDAYFLWNVLTKPLVGAVAAGILYILFMSGIVTSDFAGGAVEDLRVIEPGSVLFACAFIAAFSERWLLPQVWGGGQPPKE